MNSSILTTAITVSLKSENHSASPISFQVFPRLLLKNSNSMCFTLSGFTFCLAPVVYQLTQKITDDCSAAFFKRDDKKLDVVEKLDAKKS